MGGGGRGESVSLNRGYSKEDNSTNENQIVMHTHGDGGMFTMINTVRMVRVGGGWCMSVVAYTTIQILHKGTSII